MRASDPWRGCSRGAHGEPRRQSPGVGHRVPDAGGAAPGYHGTVTARGPGRRLALLAAAAFAALATAALPARAAAGEEPARPLSFLRVGPASGPSHLPQIVDQGGRPGLLRGGHVHGIAARRPP